MKLLAVICAALGEELYERHAKKEAFWNGLNVSAVDSFFPALTCPAQAAFRTALPVSGHGMGASGYYDRNLKKAFFWEQSARLYEGKRIWEDFRKKKGGKVAQLCLQQCPGLDSDIYLSPAPIHKHHGGMIQDFFCEPPGLYRDICRETGLRFNLMNYWGPFASRKSSDWIVSATLEVLRRFSADENVLILTYLPNLDYAPQKSGPASRETAQAFSETESMLETLSLAARDSNFEFLLTGDYEITAADTPLYPNRILLENGFLKVREVNGMLYPNLHSSTAFALADHQICHIYADNPEDLPRLKELFSSVNGIARVLERDAVPELAHPRSGELILEAERNAWFAYKWWTADSEAPDYATHVDIHNKPGFDPCEMFLTLWPPMGTSQDCSRIRGSHGRSGGKVIRASSFAWDKGNDSFLKTALQLGNMLSGE